MIPAGTKVSRFVIAAEDRRADIDLEVYRVVDGEYQLAGFSVSESGTEKVDLFDPVPGNFVSVALFFCRSARCCGHKL